MRASIDAGRQLMMEFECLVDAEIEASCDPEVAAEHWLECRSTQEVVAMALYVHQRMKLDATFLSMLRARIQKEAAAA